MIGNITLDDFYEICDKFNLEFNVFNEDYYIMNSKNMKSSEISGCIAVYDTQYKTMSVADGIRVFWTQNNKTFETIFSHLEFQNLYKYVDVNYAKKQIQNVLKDYKDIKVKLKMKEIEKDFKND